MKKIFLTILVIGFFLAPVIVFATSNDGTPIFVPLTNEEINQIILKDKKDFEEKENKKDDNSNNDLIVDQKQINSLNKEINEIQKENEDNERKVVNIINKYYSNELKKIIADIEKESDRIYYNSIPESEKKLYYLIVDIIVSKKDLSNDEKEILKDYLQERVGNAKGDLKLQTAIDSVL